MTKTTYTVEMESRTLHLSGPLYCIKINPENPSDAGIIGIGYSQEYAQQIVEALNRQACVVKD